jgi:anti-sigma factor RsiW
MRPGRPTQGGFSTSHEQAQSDIPAYLAGRLGDDDRARLEAHLTSCEECSDLVEDLRSFGGALAGHGEALFEPHPQPEELARHSRGEFAGDKARLERHLAVCATCRLEVAVREPIDAERPASSQPVIAGSRARALPLARAALLLASGIVLGVLLAPIVGGQRASSDGPIHIPVLARPTRSVSAPTRILVRPGQAEVVLAVPFDQGNPRPDTESIEIQVRATEGRVAYSLHRTLGLLRQATDASGILPLSIDRTLLPPGSYQVVVIGGGGDRDVLDLFPFDIVSEG